MTIGFKYFSKTLSTSEIVLRDCSKKNKYLKISLIVILSLLIVMIGISRIYLGVHYTSDVLGGYLLGIVYLLLFTYISDKYIKEK